MQWPPPAAFCSCYQLNAPSGWDASRGSSSFSIHFRITHAAVMMKLDKPIVPVSLKQKTQQHEDKHNWGDTITEQSGSRAKFDHPDNAAEMRNSTWLTHMLLGWVQRSQRLKFSVSLCSYLLQVWPFLRQDVIVNIHFHSGAVCFLTMRRCARQQCPAVTVCLPGRVKGPTGDWLLGNAGHLLTPLD